MIVQTMTFDEIYREVKNDAPMAYRKADALVKALRRDMLKTKKFPYGRWFEYKSPAKNDWLIYVEFPNKREYCELVVNKHYTDKGVRFVLMSLTINHRGDTEMGSLFYNGHMLRRYAERNGLDISRTEDIAKMFITDNRDIVTKPKVKGSSEVMAPVKGGAIYGNVVNNKITVINTYISDACMNEHRLNDVVSSRSTEDKFRAITDIALAARGLTETVRKIKI